MKARVDVTKNASTSKQTRIEILEIKKGDHGLLAQSTDDPHIGKTQKRTTQMTIDHVNAFLKMLDGEIENS